MNDGNIIIRTFMITDPQVHPFSTPQKVFHKNALQNRTRKWIFKAYLHVSPISH